MHDREEGFTELERDLIWRIHHRYGSWGFSSLEAFNFVSREHTDAGRYTHVSHEGEFPYDGAVDLWAEIHLCSR